MLLPYRNPPAIKTGRHSSFLPSISCRIVAARSGCDTLWFSSVAYFFFCIATLFCAQCCRQSAPYRSIAAHGAMRARLQRVLPPASQKLKCVHVQQWRCRRPRPPRQWRRTECARRAVGHRTATSELSMACCACDSSSRTKNDGDTSSHNNNKNNDGDDGSNVNNRQHSLQNGRAPEPYSHLRLLSSQPCFAPAFCFDSSSCTRRRRRRRRRHRCRSHNHCPNCSSSRR